MSISSILTPACPLLISPISDKIAEESDEYVDNIAERINQLGGVSEGTLRVCASRTQLKEYPLNISKGTDHAEALSSVMGEFGKLVRDGSAKIDETGDKGSADVLDEVADDLDKWIWFVVSGTARAGRLAALTLISKVSNVDPLASHPHRKHTCKLTHNCNQPRRTVSHFCLNIVIQSVSVNVWELLYTKLFKRVQMIVVRPVLHRACMFASAMFHPINVLHCYLKISTLLDVCQQIRRVHYR